MTTFLAQNQFISDSGTPPSTAVPDTAAADQVAPQVAAAEPIQSSCGSECADVANTAECKETHVGVGSKAIGAEVAIGPQDSISDGVSHSPSETEGAVSVSTASFDNTEHIHEIFAGAQRLPRRALPDDFQAFIDEIEREREALWADEPPLFLQRQA